MSPGWEEIEHTILRLTRSNLILYLSLSMTEVTRCQQHTSSVTGLNECCVIPE